MIGKKWEKNVISRVHVIQLTGTIFELNSHIKVTNVLTKFHENWAINVTSRKNAPPTGGHVFSPIWTIFELIQDINKTNVLTNFHDDLAKIVTSRLFIRKTAPPSSHVIQQTGTIFKLNSYKKEKIVFTCYQYIHIEKNAPPTGGHVFSPIWTIFELVRDINKTNVLTNFMMIGQKLKTAPRQPCFLTDWNHFRTQLSYQGNKCSDQMPLLLAAMFFSLIWTNFHDDWAKIVTSRVFTRHVKNTAPPTGGHVIQRTGTTFELDQDII
ncbi:hypothetical protein DPMN_009089 [Dreissena polymorpha]|uniref:Uncharacterized protein n=1 Tax=Dreissena polymorpha TaxID=45954 RepID=A0A9D4MZM7_DREPO|nr:hypothetical protein DPMN_009089 [Dreissena polymorpha]